MEKKVGLILGGIFLFSLVIVVGFVMALDNKQVSTPASVTVNEFLDITLSGAVPIAFGSNDPGTNNNPANPSGVVPQAVTITIESTTNVDTDTFLKGASWSSPAVLAITNVLYDDDNQLFGTVDNSTHETTETTLTPQNLAITYAGANTGFFENVACPCGGSEVVKSVHFWLSVPSGQKAGAYTDATIFFKTVKDGVAP